MKPLTLLLCLLLLGCEKRAADPGLEKVREWLLSAEGRAYMANRVERSGIFRIEQMEPIETWKIERGGGRRGGSPGISFSTRVKESGHRYGYYMLNESLLRIEVFPIDTLVLKKENPLTNPK